MSILPKADQDLATLAQTPAQRQVIEDAIFDEFGGMKGDRVTKLLVQGTRTAII